MRSRVTQSNFFQREAVPTKVASRASNDEIFHAGFATARMDKNVIILQPHDLQPAMLLGCSYACPSCRVRIKLSQFLPNFRPN